MTNIIGYMTVEASVEVRGPDGKIKEVVPVTESIPVEEGSP